jgi:hydrogenase maturation factor
MNLAYGEIVDVEIEDGVQLGKIRVLGAIKKVPLDLVEDVKKGDRVLLCDGVAIAKARRRRQPSIS